MAQTSPNIIEFKHDTENDLLVATVRWHILTKQDCEAWEAQWVKYMARFSRKVDVVIIADDFVIDAKIGAVWGEHRARVVNTFMRHSVRVFNNWAVRVFVNTSAVQHQSQADEARSLAEAVAKIKAMREGPRAAG